MTRSKLLEKLKSYLNAEQREQLAKYDSLKNVLRKLKKKEKALRAKLENEQDEIICSQLSKKVDILYSQRKKGIKLRKELKQQRKIQA